jgi:hypothetical protein
MVTRAGRPSPTLAPRPARRTACRARAYAPSMMPETSSPTLVDDARDSAVVFPTHRFSALTRFTSKCRGTRKHSWNLLDVTWTWTCAAPPEQGLRTQLNERRGTVRGAPCRLCPGRHAGRRGRA